MHRRRRKEIKEKKERKKTFVFQGNSDNDFVPTPSLPARPNTPITFYIDGQTKEHRDRRTNGHSNLYLPRLRKSQCLDTQMDRQTNIDWD
jgi:hypothetical protein